MAANQKCLRRTIDAFESLLTSYYTRPSHQCLRRPQAHHRRPLSTQHHPPNPEITDVAVIGGGITGLSTAYYLSKALPKSARIVLFEGSPRLGGWLNSTSVDVGNGNVVFEGGPRTLRPSVPNGLITLELVRDLGLTPRLLSTAKSSVAAQNRFIYYPDHLVRLPSSGASILQRIGTIWREPLFDKAISNTLSEVTRPRRPDSLVDESIGSFISRRFGRGVADNIVSAVFHGIYAGDIYKLSAKTILPSLWHIEGRHGSIMRGMLDQMFGGLRPVSDEDFDTIRDYQNPLYDADQYLEEGARKSSVFTFKEGLGELGDRLEERLEEAPNVSLCKNTFVNDLGLRFQTEGSKVGFTTRDARSQSKPEQWEFNHVVSTTSSTSLASQIQDEEVSNKLLMTPFVTVMVVNLFYSDPNILPVHGFGYLLPRSLPFEQNPEMALGVIFDTDATIGQDIVEGTKVTVMLGGHWWDGWTEYPDEENGSRLAQAILKRHLSIDTKPKAVRVSLQKNCIPQYVVGHEERMADLSQTLERKFSGRLRVAGNSYTGVGLNDCVRAARDTVQGLIDGRAKTGLDGFIGGRKWSWWPPDMAKTT